MSLLEWAREQPPPEKRLWGVPVRKTEFGHMVIEAEDEEDAVEILNNMRCVDVVEQAEWVEFEVEYDSCGGVWEYE